jgi:hypothetical protein
MFSEVIRLVGDAAHHGPSLSGEGPFGSVSKEFSVSCRGADGEIAVRMVFEGSSGRCSSLSRTGGRYG